VLVAVLVPIQTAVASAGSVPPEVTEYVTDGSLAERLYALYGLDASGEGIDFDETTKPGPISRVWVWTDERLAGEPTDHPVQLTNNWVVPIVIAEEPVGYATIWINPELEAPELARFDADPDAAVALAAVPPAAQLVRDDGAEAWFALENGMLTPLVPGSSGLETPAPVDEVAIVAPVEPEPQAPADSGPGLALAVGVLVLLAVVMAASLLVAARRGQPGAEPVEAPAEAPALDDLSSPAP
jgi:hypothetical protein